MTIWKTNAHPLSDEQVTIGLEHIAATSNHPLRDELILWLHIAAGMRAHEIAGLDFTQLWDQEGRVGECIQIDQRISKYTPARTISVAARVREALLRFRSGYPNVKTIGESLGEWPTPVVRKQIEDLRRKIGYRETPLRHPRVLDGAIRPLPHPSQAIESQPDAPVRSARQRKRGFRSSDLSRAVAAAKRAGLEVTMTEVTSEGAIRLSHGAAEPTSQSAYDAWKERRDARSV